MSNDDVFLTGDSLEAALHECLAELDGPRVVVDAPRPALDPVRHPSHYTAHPSGIECIEVTKHMNFCLGNAVKYVWRAGLKGDNAIEDLRKAQQYLQFEIDRLVQVAVRKTDEQRRTW